MEKFHFLPSDFPTPTRDSCPWVRRVYGTGAMPVARAVGQPSKDFGFGLVICRKRLVGGPASDEATV